MIFSMELLVGQSGPGCAISSGSKHFWCGHSIGSYQPGCGLVGFLAVLIVAKI
jgi:hypothetical protein